MKPTRQLHDLGQSPWLDTSDHFDHWVSMEVSPLLAGDTADSIAAARQIYQQGDRPNLFENIPGSPEGIPAMEAHVDRAAEAPQRGCA